MRFDILSLFPGYFETPFGQSIVQRATRSGLVEIKAHDIRDFGEGKHRKVDDRPFGGGPGMVMKPGPVTDALRSVKNEQSHVVYLTPQGKILDEAKCRALAQKQHLVLLCGHYEGIDQRALEDLVDEEISIGDFVLTSGCPAAIVLVDAVIRFLPGVLGDERSAESDSFSKGLLEHPQYAQPVVFEGKAVPEVLRSGNHSKSEQWRYAKALQKTQEVRPDLFLRQRLDEQLARPKKSQGLHPHLQVEDLQISRRFYKRVFGCNITSCGTRRLLCQWRGCTWSLEEIPLGQKMSGIPPLFEKVVENASILEMLENKLKEEGIDYVVKEDPHRALALLDPDGYQWCLRIN